MPLVDYLPFQGKILDVGSGPFSTIGTEGDITLCDILANEYRALMEKKGIKPVIPVEKQDMENMSYPDCSFDVVHCCNALDHTRNPRVALKEMVRVCKFGGWIFLRHFLNVGESNNYKGAHYWNLCVFEGDCKIWNHEDEFILSEALGLPDFCTYFDHPMVVSKGQK